MNKKEQARHDILYWLSLILAAWFFSTCWAWTYMANMVISFPFGVLSALFWFIGRRNDPNRKRYKIIVWIWIAAIVLSLAVLAYMTLFD